MNKTLPGEKKGLLFASLMRYWPVFVCVCEVQVEKPGHFVIEQVKRACLAAEVSYKEDFYAGLTTVQLIFLQKIPLDYLVPV